jgi:hypothetical protein
MEKDIITLCNLGKIQTNRLTKDIVWNSLFISDYENRYDIDANIVSDFADGYIEWLCEEFEEEIDKNDINTIFRVLDREVRNNKGGYSFYDYTHYMVCID